MPSLRVWIVRKTVAEPFRKPLIVRVLRCLDDHSERADKSHLTAKRAYLICPWFSFDENRPSHSLTAFGADGRQVGPLKSVRPGFRYFAPNVWHFRIPLAAGSPLEPVVAGATVYKVVITSEWDVSFGELPEISAPSHPSGGGNFPPYGAAAKHSTAHELRFPMESLVRRTADALYWFQIGRRLRHKGASATSRQGGSWDPGAFIVPDPGRFAEDYLILVTCSADAYAYRSSTDT